MRLSLFIKIYLSRPVHFIWMSGVGFARESRDVMHVPLCIQLCYGYVSIYFVGTGTHDLERIRRLEHSSLASLHCNVETHPTGNPVASRSLHSSSFVLELPQHLQRNGSVLLFLAIGIALSLTIYVIPSLNFTILSFQVIKKR